jgi:cytochrome c biogenesis protein CcdA/thiol-disulfide isomerase/thioredoxin
MVLLMLFGFLAGAGTALSPCVLPVLPIVLSAGATGGRRRPLGIVVGLTASFTFATVALVYVISALGLPNDLLRIVAIVVLLGFGASLLIPPLAARIEGYLSRLTGKAGAKSRSSDGFWSGTIVGASLGLVYAPCAGPILAGVITVSASQSFTIGRLAVALCYGAGSGVVLYGLMLGGRKLTTKLARKSGRLQAAMGAVMVLVAIAMLGNYDIRFETAVAAHVPSFLVDPTKHLEASKSATNELKQLNKTKSGGLADAVANANRAGGAGRDASAGSPGEALVPATGPARSTAKPKLLHLPNLGTAPDFTGNQHWFNTPGDRPVTMRQLRGKVVLVDFWTYSCINCLRTLPYLKAWDARYRSQGLTIVGVHSPEFPFEKQASNVSDAIKQNGLRYPVVQDNNLATWNAYQNQYWPAEYFIDARGQVRFAHFGEGDYGHKEQVIRTLLAEAGHTNLGTTSDAHGIAASTTLSTPESYLGSERAERFANGAIAAGLQDFGATPKPNPDGLAYGGRWNVDAMSATAQGGSLEVNFGARRVYLVLGSPGAPRHVRVLLDGHPLPDAVAGADVHGGVVTVGEQRLYALVNLPQVERHVLRLLPDSGVTGYAFTFG